MEFDEFDFVEDVRRIGLMLGGEFGGDRASKTPLSAGGPAFREAPLETAPENPVTVHPGGGAADGMSGDHVLITPPLTINREAANTMRNPHDTTVEPVSDGVLG